MWGGGMRRGVPFIGGFGRRSYGGYGASGCGCLSLSAIAIIGLFVFCLLLSLVSSCTKGCSRGSSSPQSNNVVISDADKNSSSTLEPTITHKHQKLSAADCIESSAWYDDQAGWIDDEQTLVDGLRSFYDKTGVQPYLVIADQVQGKKEYTEAEVETYLNSLYDDLFEDEGHLILLFCEPYENEYDPYLLVGEKATSVVDTEGENVIYTAIDRWYTDKSLDDNEYFARIFIASGDALMNGTRFSEYG